MARTRNRIDSMPVESGVISIYKGGSPKLGQLSVAAMWRMRMRMRLRMRLLTGYLVILAVGQLVAQHGVLGQKYYMNFAFNNNNPDANDGDAAGPIGVNAPGGPGEDSQDGQPHEGDDSGTAEGPIKIPVDDSKASSGSSDTKSTNEDSDSNSDSKSDSDSGDTSEAGIYSKSDSNPGTDGGDGDDDDSDSKDDRNRREKLARQEELGGNPVDHSHHSSYEISIDDSFGGRYVRSIYESSESHGHSGSRAGSNQRDSGAPESSEEKQQPEETNGNGPAPEEPPTLTLDADGNVADAPDNGTPGGKEDDYEEVI
ncbi:accessory gland protein Acp32CD [Drosophila ficusphila]|uniref:accessory gland protein Acp32CD n=1 Tax=Drosophila ficusphila TaxID=30025 RepID=UPI0007E6E636|nr:accessory gland protein Acp32CD [Drosophila ficusphila]